MDQSNPPALFEITIPSAFLYAHASFPAPDCPEELNCFLAQAIPLVSGRISAAKVEAPIEILELLAEYARRVYLNWDPVKYEYLYRVTVVMESDIRATIRARTETAWRNS